MSGIGSSPPCKAHPDKLVILSKLSGKRLEDGGLTITCTGSLQDNDPTVSAASGIKQFVQLLNDLSIDGFDAMIVLPSEYFETGTERIGIIHGRGRESMMPGNPRDEPSTATSPKAVNKLGLT